MTSQHDYKIIESHLAEVKHFSQKKKNNNKRTEWNHRCWFDFEVKRTCWTGAWNFPILNSLESKNVCDVARSTLLKLLSVTKIYMYLCEFPRIISFSCLSYFHKIQYQSSCSDTNSLNVILIFNQINILNKKIPRLVCPVKTTNEREN